MVIISGKMNSTTSQKNIETAMYCVSGSFAINAMASSLCVTWSSWSSCALSDRLDTSSPSERATFACFVRWSISFVRQLIKRCIVRTK